MNFKQHRNRTRLIASLLLVTVLMSSCATPAWRKSRYKTGKRFQDCGCMYVPAHNKVTLCLNEER